MTLNWLIIIAALFIGIFAAVWWYLWIPERGAIALGACLAGGAAYGALAGVILAWVS